MGCFFIKIVFFHIKQVILIKNDMFAIYDYTINKIVV